MINKIKKALKKRKVKLFLIFLLCSGLAWFISKLSETYTSNTAFDIEYVGIPSHFLLKSTSKDKIDVKLRAIGFQFLGFNIKKKKVNIDLSKIKKRDTHFFIPQHVYRKQVERQLTNSMALIEIDRDTLFFIFQEVSSKKVSVNPRIQLNLAQNHILDGTLKIEPSTIIVTGPKNEIDTIKNVQTVKLDLNELTTDFSHKVNIYKPTALKNTSFSFEHVTVHGKIFRFSEKIIEIPIKVINLPEGTRIKTFPNKVSVLCKAKISELKDLDSSAFQIITDYSDISTSGSKEMLVLKLSKKPKKIHSAVLLENQVEYILKRE